MALNCYFESQSENLPSVDLINSVVTENIKIDIWNRDCLNSFIYFLTNVTHQTMSRGNSYLDKVRTVSIQRSNLQKFIAKLANHLSGMTNLSVLKLSDCSLTASNMKHIASSLGEQCKPDWSKSSRNKALGGSAISWSPHLKQMKHLQKLDLSYCSLTGEDLKHIAVSLSDMPTLVELNLSGNEALGGSAISWSPHLKQMKHLQKLHLSDCSLTDEDMKHIAVSLSDMPTLVELNLSGNKALGGSAISWSPHLKQMKHLQKLHLSWCSLTREDMKHIAVSLSDMPTLVELNLLGNKALGGSAISWSPHLKQMKHLQKLHLSGCSLTGEDMKHIAHVSLSDMPTLVELNLSGNKALGGSAISWSPHLKQMKHFRSCTWVIAHWQVEDMKHIAVSLIDMPTLVEFNLSW